MRHRHLETVQIVSAQRDHKENVLEWNRSGPQGLLVPPPPWRPLPDAARGELLPVSELDVNGTGPASLCIWVVRPWHFMGLWPRPAHPPCHSCDTDTYICGCLLPIPPLAAGDHQCALCVCDLTKRRVPLGPFLYLAVGVRALRCACSASGELPLMPAERESSDPLRSYQHWAMRVCMFYFVSNSSRAYLIVVSICFSLMTNEVVLWNQTKPGPLPCCAAEPNTDGCRERTRTFTPGHRARRAGG